MVYGCIHSLEDYRHGSGAVGARNKAFLGFVSEDRDVYRVRVRSCAMESLVDVVLGGNERSVVRLVHGVGDEVLEVRRLLDLCESL